MRGARKSRPQTARTTKGRRQTKDTRAGQADPRGRAPGRDVPRWDAAAGELWWRGALLRRVRPDAANQRLVLGAFQRRRWPPRIDNPLPNGQGMKRKEQLRNTVKALNGRRGPAHLRFRVRAGGVTWEVVI